MVKKTPAKKKAAPPAKGERDRVRPQFAVLRQAIINIRAGQGDSTADIAEAFGVNRSYVIRLTSFGMKPTNAPERAVAKQAAEYLPALQRMGMGFAAKDGFETKLAGDDGNRGKGGGRPRLNPKPAKPLPAKAKPKAKAVAKPPSAKPKPKVQAKVKPRVAAPRRNVKPAKATNGAPGGFDAGVPASEAGRVASDPLDTLVADVASEAQAVLDKPNA
jgi:hypothetical protein